MKRLLSLFVLVSSLFSMPTFGQSSTSFSVGELNSYFGEYLKPVVLGLATGMGSGWAHEAAPHNTLGFDVSISAVAVQIPTSAMNFSTSNLSGMIDNGYSFGFVTELPTMASPDVTNANISKSLSSNGVSQEIKIPALNGLDIPYTPNASLQVAVGLPKGTEVMGRFMPDVGSSINNLDIDGIHVNEMNIWGIGVKHDIKQWIPAVSRIPVLEISALVAYSKFNFDMTSTDIALSPAAIADASGLNIVDNTSSLYDDQGFAMEMSSLTGSLMFGANIPIVHPFVAVGFNKASVNTGLTGTYPIIQVNPSPTSADDILEVNETENGPTVESEKTFVNFQAGLSVKVAILSIHAQYTYQEYSMYSVGLAVGIR